MRSPPPVAAAWVPDDDAERDWDEAAALVVVWVDERCADEGATGLLVTHTLDDHNVPSLDVFKRFHGWCSPRGGAGRSGATGPVLVYVPDPKLLRFALRKAHRSSLGVIEGSHSMAGWAAIVGAVNLLNGETAPCTDAFRQCMETLEFYGNNGFGDDFGQLNARRAIGDLLGQEEASDEDIVSGAVAMGVSDLGAKNLARRVLPRVRA